MFKTINHFITDETGAVTVDWVVLTAAIITLSLTVFLIVAAGANDAGATISTAMAEIDTSVDP